MPTDNDQFLFVYLVAEDYLTHAKVNDKYIGKIKTVHIILVLLCWTTAEK